MDSWILLDLPKELQVGTPIYIASKAFEQGKNLKTPPAPLWAVESSLGFQVPTKFEGFWERLFKKAH